MKLETTFSGSDEEWYVSQRWENKTPDQQAGETDEAWTRWVIASCAEWTGGHRWWLNWDEFDGLDLHCRHCPAGVDELYPDGNDSLYGELPVPGYEPLRIDAGEVKADPALLGTSFDEGEETEMCVVGWGGPVRAWVETKTYPGGPWGPAEYDAWVFVEAV